MGYGPQSEVDRTACPTEICASIRGMLTSSFVNLCNGIDRPLTPCVSHRSHMGAAVSDNKVAFPTRVNSLIPILLSELCLMMWALVMQGTPGPSCGIPTTLSPLNASIPYSFLGLSRLVEADRSRGGLR
jgi:hypothetical protein